MRKLSILMGFLFFTACSAIQISTDRQIYSPLEDGVLTVSLNVPTDYQRIMIEIEILDSLGHLVYGDVMQSAIPEQIFGHDISETNMNLTWTEVPENNTVTRQVPFTIPGTASDGDYTIVARALYQDSTVQSDTTNMSIVGSLPFVGSFEIIFIVALILAFIIWKEV